MKTLKIGVVSGVISTMELESEESEQGDEAVIDQVQCSYPHFVIGLVLLLLLVTPIT